MQNYTCHPGNGKKGMAVMISVLLATGLVIIPFVAPDLISGDTISSEARNLAAIFLIILTLWITEALPIAVTALLAIILQALLGVTGAREAFA